MQTLRFLSQKENALVFTNQLGEEFRIDLDDEHITALKSALRPSKISGATVKPREIQAMLRAGSSTQEVAETLDLDVADVERYEGPILAERDFILRSSHAIEVRTADSGADEIQLFGDVINERIQQAAASEPEWSVWKDDNGDWILRALFILDETERNADWIFDPKKKLLTPISTDAINLSKQSDASEKIIPTLRAVEDPVLYDDLPEEEEPYQFDFDEEHPEGNPGDDSFEPANRKSELVELSPEEEYSRRQKIEEIAISSDRSEFQATGDTAELLDALRYRRSSREHSQAADAEHLPDELMEPQAPPPTLISNEQFETVALPTFNFTAPEEPEDSEPASPKKTKKGRKSIPSWDQILFGKPEED